MIKPWIISTMVGVIWRNKRLDKMLSQSVSGFAVLVEQRILLTQLPKIMLNLPVIYGSRIAVLIYRTIHLTQYPMKYCAHLLL